MNIKRIFYFLKNEPEYLYNEGKKFASTLFTISNQRLLRGRSFTLKKLWLVLTYRCNLQCEMCGQWGEKGRSKEFAPSILKQELTMDEYKSIIDEVVNFHPRIMLIGGEPLLYSKWDELAKYIKEKNLRVEITTNGLLLKENAKKMVNLIDSINVSLDGPPQINDEIRKLKDGWKRAIDGIKEIQNLKGDSLKPYLNICCTIHPKNVGHLFSLIESLEKENLKINLLLFQHLEFINDEILKNNQKIWEEEFKQDSSYWRSLCHQYKEHNIDRLKEEIKKIKNYKSPLIDLIMIDPDFSDEEIDCYYTHRQITRFKNICYAPFLEAFIYPEGNVWTCPGLIMGNIKEKKFLSIWNDKNYQTLRRVLNKKKWFPVCQSCANHWHNWS